MNDIVMVNYILGVWWGQEIGLSELINVLFSSAIERLILSKVNIDVFVGSGGIKK